jgi:hypothetical protein
LICYKLGIAVLKVDYRHAPEYPFPTGSNDVYDAIKWVRHAAAFILIPVCLLLVHGQAVDHAKILDLNPKKGVIVAGVSGGVTYALTIAHVWRDLRHPPPISGHVPINSDTR